MSHHRLRAALAAALAVLCLPLSALAATPSAVGQASPPAVAPAASRVASPAVLAAGFTTSDLDRSLAFFTTVLGFEAVDEDETWGAETERVTGVFGARVRRARLRLGAERLELSEYLAPRGRSIPEDARSTDRTFQHVAIVVSDMDAAYQRLRDARVRHVSTAPQRLPDWNPNAGGIEAFYFQDFDGHNLELIFYPPGKGHPRWQPPVGGRWDRLFLGIDHTAIGIGSTAASLAFWRDGLGLALAGGAENWGSEQEHLNQVHGAHLRISGLLGAPQGALPGLAVEFLEYLSPPTGRPAPVDLAANDLVHWQTTVRVVDPVATAERLRDFGGRLVSPPPLPGSPPAPMLVRDPDGHGLLLVPAAGG